MAVLNPIETQRGREIRQERELWRQ
jgi:hypothetical protein